MTNTSRFLVCGPSNSCKSTFALSLVDYLISQKVTAKTIELDPWSNSYVAFRGECTFENRPKINHLNWEWKEAVDRRIKQYTEDDAQVVLGDMIGKLGEGAVHILKKVREVTNACIIISRTVEGLRDWRIFIRDYDIPVIGEFLTIEKLGALTPIVLPVLERKIQPDHPAILSISRLVVPKRMW
ncbi:MAG: hypothetical protein U9Q03_02875 [Patescibacteria group bacterium]|nr:hypothetical protein [Patescibacteria group bacterium]